MVRAEVSRKCVARRRRDPFPAAHVAERLENRTLFAFNLTLSTNPTVDVTTTTVGTTTTMTASKTGANVNWVDVSKALVGGRDVVINTGAAGTEAGNIVDNSADPVRIDNALGTSLTLQTGSGPGLVGSVTLNSVGLSGTRSSITVGANAAVRAKLLQADGLVSISSVTGAITGSVSASRVSLSAAAGIGTGAVPLSTTASNLVAKTATGGIFVNNSGNLAIGFTGAPFTGVQVAGVSGDVQVIASGNLTITASNVVRAPGNLTLISKGGAISDNNPAAADVIASGLIAQAAGGISLDTTVSTLAFNNTGGAVVVQNSGALSIGPLGTLTASSNSGTTTTLSASSSIIFSATTSSSGNLTATAKETTPAKAGVDDITVNAGVSIISTGGDVTLTAGDDLIVGATANVVAPNGSINLNVGAADNDAEGAMTLNGTVSANTTSGTVTLNASVAGGGVSEAATGKITAAGLLLLDLVSAGASFSLDASTTNTVGTIAGGTNAAVKFNDSVGLNIGTVTSVDEGITGSGISTGGHDLTLTTTAGSIAISRDINVGAATATLLSAEAISETSPAQVKALNLELQGPQGIGLVNAPITTRVSGLAARNVHGGVIVANTGDLTIGFPGAGTEGVIAFQADVQITNVGSVSTTSSNGINSGADIEVTASGASSDIQTAPGTGFSISGNGTVSLSSGRDILIGTGGIFSGDLALAAGRDIVVAGKIQAAATHHTAAATAGRNITFQQNGAIDSASGAITLAAGPGGTVSMAANAVVDSTVPGPDPISPPFGAPITLSADDMSLGGMIKAGVGDVTLQQQGTSPRNIDLGTDSAGNLALTPAEIASVTGGTLRIGRTDNPGNISVTKQITRTGTLSLQTGGAILDNNSTEPDVRATSLALRAGGISLDTAVTNIAFNAAGTVRISNAGGMIVAPVDGLASSTNSGATTLSAIGPITFAVNAGGGGTLTAAAAEAAPAAAGVDDIVVSPGVNVTSTSGDVDLLAGDDILVDTGARVQAAQGSVDLRSGAGDNDNEGNITVKGTVSADSAAGTVALNMNAPTGAAVETASGALTGAGLLLLNFPAGSGFALDASTQNAVGTLAATTHATIVFRNSIAFSVGSVTSSNEGITSAGILTNGGGVRLLAAAGDLALAQAVNADTATVDLSAAGAVTQGAAGKITSGDLVVVAGGDIALSTANPTNHVTGAVTLDSATATVSFTSDTGFTVGGSSAGPIYSRTAAAAAPFAAGVNSTKDVTLTSTGGGITVAQDITAAILTLRPQGGGIQQTSGAITADSVIQPEGPSPSTYAGSISAGAGGVNLTGTDFTISGRVALNSGPLVLSNTGTAIVSGSISGSGAVTINGPGPVTLSGANTYTGPTTLSGGALTLTAAGGLPASTALTNNGNLRVDATAALGPITGTGTLLVSAGILTVPSFDQSGVTVASGGTLRLTGPSAATSDVVVLNIESGGVLDLIDNALKIAYPAGSDPIATIRAYVAAGGIMSSLDDANHAVGYGDSADGTVAGLPAHTLLVRSTRRGDVNLDGGVGFADLLILAQNYNQHGRNWDQGDLDRDGTVNFADLLALAQNYGGTAAAPRRVRRGARF